jgi:sporulation protein YlmC with PRC-barrel domain
MNLVRDVLDTQIVGRDGRRMGRVDGLIIETREGAPPKVAYIEMGAEVLAGRLSSRLAAWVARLRNRFWKEDTGVFRVPWSRVRDVGFDIEIDMPETTTTRFQEWLRREIVARMPGGRL